MKTRAFSLLACGAFALATAACSSKTPDGTGSEAAAADMNASSSADDAMASPAADAGSDAAAFVADGMKGDNSEVKLGKLAASKGSTAAVRDYGTMLATDHGKHKQDLAKLGGTMNVAATDDTTPEADAEYTKLQGLSGAAFDKEFATFMVTDHQKAIAKYQAQADGSGPAPLVALAKDTLPKLKKHLETAQSLAK